LNPFRRILLATDLSQNCESAFCHALKMVVQSQGEFHLLHVDPEGQASFREFPQVRERLSQWGLLPEGVAREAVGELGIEIFKRLDLGDPLQGILEESEQFDAQLLVMATHARQGWSRLLGESVSHAAVRHSGLPGLLFPPHEEGFVDPDNGHLKLERILIPVASSPDPRPAYRAALRVLDTLKPPVGCLLRVHVGAQSAALDEFAPPDPPPGWEWQTRLLSGEPEAALIELAREWRPQLSVMTSKGRSSWRDLFRGSSLEQLLGRLRSPVLVVPES